VATDRNGKEIKKGALITVRARVTNVGNGGFADMLSATTEANDRAISVPYSLPVLHASQVEVVDE